MELKIKLLIALGIIIILAIPVIFFGFGAYLAVIVLLAILIGGLFGFVWIYNKLFNEWL